MLTIFTVPIAAKLNDTSAVLSPGSWSDFARIDRFWWGALTLASRSFAVRFISVAARLLAGQRYVRRAAG